MKIPARIIAGALLGCLAVLALRKVAARDVPPPESREEDTEGEDSFPASDPPSSSGAHA